MTKRISILTLLLMLLAAACTSTETAPAPETAAETGLVIEVYRAPA